MRTSAPLTPQEHTAATARLAVVGLGPGDEACMTGEARARIESADVVVGYTPYVQGIPPAWLAGKTVITGGMRDEIARCEAAVRAALAGRTTVLVCSGDPGVYALAGLTLELVDAWGLGDTLPVDIVPGIPAVCAAASLLGAPLTHDFACVSLSDLLTPWEVIERRIRAALEGDFVLVVYNPRSRQRDWQFSKVLELIRIIKGDNCVTGVVRNGYRSGMSVWTGLVNEVEPEKIDMVSIVLFGNRSTRLIQGRMVTPRGYLDKYDTGNPRLITEDGRG